MKHAARVIPGAVRADLDALPRTWRGEILEGTLYAFPRPRAGHANIESLLDADLKNPFQRGRATSIATVSSVSDRGGGPCAAACGERRRVAFSAKAGRWAGVEQEAVHRALHCHCRRRRRRR
jgi:hypothetical protein